VSARGFAPTESLSGPSEDVVLKEPWDGAQLIIEKMIDDLLKSIHISPFSAFEVMPFESE